MSTASSQQWTKLKQAAMGAPAIITTNLCSQIIELQNHISSREPGARFPSLQEVNLICKLVNCMEKLKKYPSEQMTMQAITGFVHFVGEDDADTGYYLNDKLDEYLSRKGNSNFRPFDMEYDIDPFSMPLSAHEAASAPTAEPAYASQSASAGTPQNSPTASYTSAPQPTCSIAPRHKDGKMRKQPAQRKIAATTSSVYLNAKKVVSYTSDYFRDRFSHLKGHFTYQYVSQAMPLRAHPVSNGILQA